MLIKKVLELQKENVKLAIPDIKDQLKTKAYQLSQEIRKLPKKLDESQYLDYLNFNINTIHDRFQKYCNGLVIEKDFRNNV